MPRHCVSIIVALLLGYGGIVVAIARELSTYAKDGVNLGSQMLNSESFVPEGQRLFKLFRFAFFGIIPVLLVLVFTVTKLCH